MICGGDGNDTIDGGAGADELSGAGPRQGRRRRRGLMTPFSQEAPAAIAVDSPRSCNGDEGATRSLASGPAVGSRFNDKLTVRMGRTTWPASRATTTSLLAPAPTDPDGGSGSDLLKAGNGYDTVDFNSSPARIVANLASGRASGYGCDRL